MTMPWRGPYLPKWVNCENWNTCLCHPTMTFVERYLLNGVDWNDCDFVIWTLTPLPEPFQPLCPVGPTLVRRRSFTWCGCHFLSIHLTHRFVDWSLPPPLSLWMCVLFLLVIRRTPRTNRTSQYKYYGRFGFDLLQFNNWNLSFRCRLWGRQSWSYLFVLYSML